MLERYESALPLFAYDASIDLDTQISDSIETGEVLVQDVTFASPSGARVGATIVTPKGDGPFPALLIVDADNRRDEMDLAEAYAAEFGVLSLMIDPPPARSDDIDRPGLGVYTFTERDHGEQIQFVIDLRRALDLLEAREDVDSSRIGVRAFGLGAETAAILSGVDGRVGGYNLINLVGGPVTFYGDPGAEDAEFLALDPEERRHWLTTMEPIEPVYFIGHASPAQLLFQLEGELFRDNARLLLEVASEPKEVEWVEPGTGFQADCRAADWFARLFDLGDGHLFPECEG
jgi:dienelactone hydrolase